MAIWGAEGRAVMRYPEVTMSPGATIALVIAIIILAVFAQRRHTR